MNFSSLLSVNSSKYNNVETISQNIKKYTEKKKKSLRGHNSTGVTFHGECAHLFFFLNDTCSLGKRVILLRRIMTWTIFGLE